MTVETTLIGATPVLEAWAPSGTWRILHVPWSADAAGTFAVVHVTVAPSGTEDAVVLHTTIGEDVADWFDAVTRVAVEIAREVA